jgi:hypothetical protein
MPSRGCKLLDLTGQRYGRLIVRSCLGTIDGRRSWSCWCDCGQRDVAVQQNHLRSGKTRSCGCLRRENMSRVGKGRKRSTAPRRLAGVERLRSQGLSMQQIGERLGITKQRVHQLLQVKAGIA